MTSSELYIGLKVEHFSYWVSAFCKPKMPWFHISHYANLMWDYLEENISEINYLGQKTVGKGKGKKGTWFQGTRLEEETDLPEKCDWSGNPVASSLGGVGTEKGKWENRNAISSMGHLKAGKERLSWGSQGRNIGVLGASKSTCLRNIKTFHLEAAEGVSSPSWNKRRTNEHPSLGADVTGLQKMWRESWQQLTVRTKNACLGEASILIT